MDLQAQRSETRFSAYVEGLASVIGHGARMQPLRDYCVGLLMPCEVAVTTATPTGPGVQIWGTLKESHVPAHAIPLLAMVRTAVLLEINCTGVVTAVPVLF